MKKTIDWLALVLGLALALFGARWMWTGWDIVQAERGWASLIAGSVMLSGGLIVAMLAWTVMRLAGAPAARREAPAQLEEVVDQTAPSLAPARPKMPAAPIVAGAGALAGTAVAAGAALAHETPPPAAPLADDFKSEIAPEGVIEPPPLPPVAPPTVGELLRMSEERVVRESHEKHFEEPEAILPPADDVPPPLDDAKETSAAIEKVETVASEIVATITPLEPLAAEPKVEPPPEPEAAKPEASAPIEPLRIPEPAPASPTTADEPVYDDWLERTAREFDRELGRDALPKDEGALPEPPQPATPKPEPAVVGRYSSGDTNYLMFADGSIEAQTPEGIMRFGSLTELKRFVEKRN